MSDNNVEVLFKDDATVLDHEGNVEFEAKAGKKGKVKKESANRWVRREMETQE